MARIVALGPAEDAMPYLAMGAELREARSTEDLARELAGLAHDPSVALVLIAEEQAAAAGPAVAAFRAGSAAALLVLPSAAASRGAALAEMKHFLEHAIGVDLIGKG